MQSNWVYQCRGCRYLWAMWQAEGMKRSEINCLFDCSPVRKVGFSSLRRKSGTQQLPCVNTERVLHRPAVSQSSPWRAGPRCHMRTVSLHSKTYRIMQSTTAPAALYLGPAGHYLERSVSCSRYILLEAQAYHGDT